MNISAFNYKKGFSSMAVCYFIWGFQPLYFALGKDTDNAFLLACRIVWAAVMCFLIVKAQGKLPALREVFCSSQILKKEIPAAVLLFADWGIYLYAVRCGRVMECSMGYYIMPLVMYAFGALIFRENFSKRHIISLVLIFVGIILSAGGFGGFPFVTAALSLCFAVYSALKKSLTVDSIVSTTAEILIMLPFALLFIFVFRREENGLSGVTLLRQLFLIGSGILTGLPMVFFAIGVRNLPLSLCGIFQYVSPTLGLICSRILGEKLTKEKLISFIFIWAGVIVYSIFEVRKKA